MKLIHLSPLILSLPLASSQTTTTSTRICTQYLIPLSITSQVLTPSYPPFTSNYDVVGFVNDLTRRPSNTTFVPFSGAKNETASYTIGATLCSPRNSSKETTLLVATHGLGYDRRYWDSEIQPGNYSFVDFAISRGYSIFFYDRLGTGSSSKVSGYSSPQAATQLAILQQLSTLLISGSYTGPLGKPSKIVHVGHSFGSLLTNALLHSSPSLSSGAILTGIAYPPPATPKFNSASFMLSWGLRIASSIAPGKWPYTSDNNGYLTWESVFGNVAVFFSEGTYDEEVVWWTEDAKQPIAAIELLTSGTLTLYSPDFVAPVLVISGEFDAALCGGDCKGFLDTGRAVFPNATDFQAVVHPEVGHGINFSYNATGAYSVMLNFLGKNGL